MKRALKISGISILSIAIIVLIATLVLSYIVGDKLTHPVRKPIAQTPQSVSLSYKNITFQSRIDHVSLSGWLIPAATKTHRIVVEAHGYRENRSSEPPLLPTAKSLHDAGFAVLMFDFRDEGKSGGKEVSVGQFETRDLLGAIDYAKSLGYTDVGVYGLSMGASVALEATAQDPDVEATIADSPFADLKTYLKSNMGHWTHLPSFPFNREIIWEMGLFFGINPAKVDPLQELATAKPRPILLIAGTADTTVPMKNSQVLYKELKGNPNDQLWIVPGATHIHAYEVNPTKYETRVVSFFDEYLGTTSPS